MNADCNSFVRIPEKKATYATTENGVDFKPAAAASANKPIISVLPALCKTFAPEFLFGSALKLVQDLLAFVSPQLLKYLISYVENPEQEEWKGYLYAILLTITAIVQTVFLSQYFQRMFVVGMRIRTAIVSSIYRKVTIDYRLASLLF